MKTRRDFISTAAMATAGMVLASPTRSSIGGSMTSLIAKSAAPIALPYVMDGLEAFWDGEWNIGPELHDSSTTTWVDLSGHKRHMYAPAPLWGENHAYCDGSTMNQIFRQTGQESGWFVDIIESGKYTIEIVQSMDEAHGDPLFLCNGEEANFALRGTVINANNSGFRISMNGTINAVRCTVDGINYMSKRCHQIAADVSIGIAGVNGAYSMRETDFVVSTTYNRGVAIGARGDLYGTPYYSKGLCMYRVAIYSRGLSQDELEFNLATDVERFGI